MLQKNTYLPLYVDMKEKKILIYGAGKIAKRRIQVLTDFDAQVYVVAPRISDEVRVFLQGDGNLTIIEKEYTEGEIKSFDMVFAATNDETVNHNIYLECKKKQIPVNNASNQQECDFFFPAVIRDENLVIGITSGGTNHKKVRDMAAKIRAILKEKGHGDY